MEHYQKGEVTRLPVKAFDDVLDENRRQVTAHIHVQPDSKVNRLIGYAIGKIKNDGFEHLIWISEADRVGNAVKCADAVRRRFKKMAMLRREALKRLRVVRELKVTVILLSSADLTAYSSESGYTSPVGHAKGGVHGNAIGSGDAPQAQKTGNKRSQPRERSKPPHKHQLQSQNYCPSPQCLNGQNQHNRNRRHHWGQSRHQEHTMGTSSTEPSSSQDTTK